MQGEFDILSVKTYRELTKDTHRIERILAESAVFKGEKFPFTSPRVQQAYNEIVNARMFGGDCLRLLLLGIEARENVRFIPSEHGATHTGDIIKDFSSENYTEIDLIMLLKAEIRTVFYGSLHAINYAWTERMGTRADISLSLEMSLYQNQLSVALKKADQQLGLRIGEMR